MPASPTRRHAGLQYGVAPVIAKSLQLTVSNHAVLQSFRQPTVDVFPVGVQLGCPLWPRLGPDGFRRVQIPAHRVPGDAPGLQQCPGWSGPLLSSRRSLSLVPPSTKFRRHLHEIFVNNALAVRWVNSASAISLIFTSTVTSVHREDITQVTCDTVRVGWRGRPC